MRLKTVILDQYLLNAKVSLWITDLNTGKTLRKIYTHSHVHIHLHRYTHRQTLGTDRPTQGHIWQDRHITPSSPHCRAFFRRCQWRHILIRPMMTRIPHTALTVPPTMPPINTSDRRPPSVIGSVNQPQENQSILGFGCLCYRSLSRLNLNDIKLFIWITFKSYIQNQCTVKFAIVLHLNYNKESTKLR